MLPIVQLLLNTLLVPLGALLWFWGGCGKECHPGLPPLNKSWRRHVWPAVVGLALVLNGFWWAHAVGVTLLMIVANTQGYGEGKTWVWRCIVALGLGAPFLIISPTIVWPLATLLVFIPLYILSLKYNWMTWGVVEAATGATQGAIAVLLITTLVTVRSIISTIMPGL